MDDLIQRYMKLQTPTVYDVMDKMGISNQALSAAIQPLDRRMKMAGRAFTIKGSSAARYDGENGRVVRYDVFRQITRGSVIVMDTGGNGTSGPWGRNTGANAKAAGATGIVIDGGTRDALELIEMAFPAFVRFTTPVLSHGRWQVDDVNVPVTMSGQVEEYVRVCPGDIVLGDGDGVVVVPAEIAAEVLEYAEYVQAMEAKMGAALDRGEDREQVDKRYNRWQLMRERDVLKRDYS